MDTTTMERPLTWKQQNMLDQVAATMAIEDMPLTEDILKMGADIVTGKKTVGQVIQELNRRNWNE